jgi:hypothetical protein
MGAHKGTFSLDTKDGAGGAWRMEGAWLLPFEGRAIYVPELDCVVGLTSGETRLLCACDVRSLPNGDLHLARRGKMSYMRPPQGRQSPYIGFIQPAT